jgi:hypothetical protein
LLLSLDRNAGAAGPEEPEDDRTEQAGERDSSRVK